ncbi:type VI secretion system baseplate subunit TssG [Photobacterium alginatilyticum]|uniref:type VI secretion system baseplate subunit TssG n=1 Tax=Photobacterium alginatilyticum TaxID=1775171 RepID=UPI004067E556
MKLKRVINQLDKDDFYQSVYTLQRVMQGGSFRDELGTDTLPRNEQIRFSVSQQLGFPGSAIEKINENTSDDGRTRIDVSVNSMGLTGPSGVLPRHYTELLIQRSRLKDVAIRDFFDLFNHRLIALNYRAWEKYQFPAQYERSLSGNSTPSDDVLRALSGATQDAEVSLGGLFAQPIRKTKSLQQILMILSGCKVMVHEFVGRWLFLEHTEQTRLASRIEPEGQHAQLGVSSILGKRVWDLCSAIEIEIQPSEQAKAMELMTEGSLLSVLKNVTRQYVPASIHVRWKITTTYRNLPVACLGSHGPGLGLGGALMVRIDSMDKALTIPVG